MSVYITSVVFIDGNKEILDVNNYGDLGLYFKGDDYYCGESDYFSTNPIKLTDIEDALVNTEGKIKKLKEEHNNEISKLKAEFEDKLLMKTLEISRKNSRIAELDEKIEELKSLIIERQNEYY